MNVKHLILSTVLALFSFYSAQAEEVTEGFESVTLTNADTWGRATELSNGWKIQGGYIGTSKDTYDYGFWTTAHDGSKSLTAQYGGINNAYVIIPTLLTGDVTFYYRKTSSDSRTAGKVYAYKVTESNGTYTIGTRIFMDESATTSWQQCTSIKLTEPTMIAFKMVRAAMDDVVYTTASLDPHEHDYAAEWSSDENEHWHACTSTVGICDAKKIDVAAHDGLTCSVCGYKVPGIEAFPWSEDFNSITSGIPEGWDNSEGTTTTASYKWNYYLKSVRFDSYNNTTGNTNVLATPLLYIPATGVYELRFKVKNPKGGDYEVKIGEYGSAERTTLFDNLTNIADWTEKTVSLAAYAGKAVKVYFCGTSNYGSGDAYLYLDDVIVKESITHNHNYAEEWSHDYNNHWHACTSAVGECDAPQSCLEAHTLNADGICTVCGYDQPYREDFEGGIPASWTNKGWTIKDNPSYGNGTKMAYAGAGSSAASNTLVSPKLSAKAGDVLEFEALQLWNDEYLTMEYSTDMGATWTQAIHVVPAANNTLHTLQFTAPAAGVYQLRFSGAYNYIDNVCGFKLAQIPAMEVATTAGATKEGNVFTDNFGRQTENASHTYTVANTGAGILVVNITSDNADFTVSEATLEMGAGESKTFDVTFVHSSTFGIKSAAITVAPTFEGLAAVTINATANCADPEGFFEDFEGGIPATWQNNGWTIQTKNGSKMAYSLTSDEYKLTTPRLQASEGEVLCFDAFQQWDDEPLKLEYSTDGGYTWTTAFEEAPAANNTARQFTFTAPEDGYYYLRFSGSYNYIDNVGGFKLAPVVLEEGTLALTYKWATLCYPANVIISEGIQAFTVADVEDDVLTLEEVAGTVSAGTPVILYSAESATQTLPAVTLPYLVNQPVRATYGNILVGCYGAMQLDDSKQYVLQEQNGVIAFYRINPEKPFTTAAFRSYLEFSKPQGAMQINIGGDFDTTVTSIRKVEGTAQSGKIYDLSGNEVKTLRKGGIYIMNGKKVIIK